ncbi:MAG: transcriptional repressor [Flavobacteriales bacterium]|nr:transcriptional repressor [Flavobacteriales bacterium]
MFSPDYSSTTSENYLKDRGLRPTRIRVMVVDILKRQPSALTPQQIQEALPQDIDRVTFYRTILNFERHGVVHRVAGDDGHVRYALCRHEHASSGSLPRSEDHHPHFLCQRCDRTFCLEEVPIQDPILPVGFRAETVSFFLRGTCADCNPEKNKDLG